MVHVGIGRGGLGRRDTRMAITIDTILVSQTKKGVEKSLITLG